MTAGYYPHSGCEWSACGFRTFGSYCISEDYSSTQVVPLFVYHLRIIVGISGGAISVMRAVSMAILYTYGNFREKEILPWSIVGFTAFIFLLIDPSQLFSLSFQLSFGAVGGILFMLAQFRKLTENNKWLQSLRSHTSFRLLMDALVVSFGVQLGTFLPCLLYTSPSPRDRTRSRMPSSA